VENSGCEEVAEYEDERDQVRGRRMSVYGWVGGLEYYLV
jgi:hypothetical protein